MWLLSFCWCSLCFFNMHKILYETLKQKKYAKKHNRSLLRVTIKQDTYDIVETALKLNKREYTFFCQVHCVWETVWTPKPEGKKNQTLKQTQTLQQREYKFYKAPLYTKQRSQLARCTIPVHFHYVKPARDEYNCSTKCHLWHIIRGSKCLGSCFRNKLLTAGDDETERIQNYSRTPQNLLNLLQPGACPSPSPWEKERHKVRKGPRKLVKRR